MKARTAILAFVGLLAFATIATPQKYVPIQGSTANLAAGIAVIDPGTGDVYIDWALVRMTANGKGALAGEPVAIYAAKIMLAIRDGKWKAMPR